MGLQDIPKGKNPVGRKGGEACWLISAYVASRQKSKA